MSYGPMEEAHVDSVAELEAAAFAFPAGEAGDWFARAGHENMRVFREGDSVAAALMLVPMGQFFGGRSVKTMGVAGVAVALDRRQRKLGQRLMKASLLEAHERGFALSTLYPATRTLYRSVGYDLAGKLVEITLHTSRLELCERFEPLDVRPMTAELEPLTEALYAERAAALHGHLDRGPYIWSRVRRPRKGTCRGFAFFDDESLVAYTYFTQESQASGHDHDAVVTDFVAKDARGYAALFEFYRGQRSVLDSIRLKGNASAPYLSLLREPRHDEEAMIDWMIRIVDLPAAVLARGYSPRTSATVTVEVRDEVIAENRGVWTISLEDGTASVKAGGTPRVSLDIRALAPIYAGYYTASEACLLGALAGEADACQALDAIFQSPMPGMSEMF